MMDDIGEEILEQRCEAPEPKQAELVKLYCGRIEGRMQAASSYLDAQQIADTACREFDAHCESDVVRGFLRQHINRLLLESWGPASVNIQSN